MSWITLFLIHNERATAIIISLLLIALNAGSLYFIIDLLSYDEIVGYLDDGGLKCTDPHDFVYAQIIIALFNLLFVFSVLYARFTKTN